MTEAVTEDDLMVECELEAAPEKVWRALTVPEFVAAWLLPNDLDRAEPGSEFALDGSRHGLSGRIACTVLEAEPQRKLRMSWREDDEVATVVTFELTPNRQGGTSLRVRHGPLATSLRAANGNMPPLALAA